MGWFWGKSASPNTDPLRDLDPSLRDFLSKESPVKYKPAPAPPPPPPKETLSAPATKEIPTTAASGSPQVSSKSLYPDGRYAHLWKNYRPQSEIEAEGKSDQEKLLDVLEGYKERKAQIGRTAVENCVMEQLAVEECYNSGRWKDRMMMCRTETKAFERCYILQSRFLKALGYLSTYERPPSVDEEIQMHADTLYHRMLAQEAAIEAAKASNSPIPEFAPILAPASQRASSTSAASTPTATPSSLASTPGKEDDLGPPLSPMAAAALTPSAAAALRERMKDMSPLEREIEERSVVMEVKDADATGRQLNKIREGRRKRREEGKATAGDTISGWFGQ